VLLRKGMLFPCFFVDILQNNMTITVVLVTEVYTINPLKPNGNYTSQLSQQPLTLYSVFMGFLFFVL
jgi:hypothetical protein